VDELSYPSFPRRAFLAIAAVMLALAGVVVAVRESGADLPSVAGCAVGAERVMAAHDYSVDLMALIGPSAVRPCRGLSRRQYGQALLDTYRIEYGRNLPKLSSSNDRPSPAFRTRSAEAALRSLGSSG
jgi:hypothetical protein